MDETSQLTVTIQKRIDGAYVQVELPVAEFTAMYTNDRETLRSIASRFDITVSGVCKAAQLLKLPSKADNFIFKRKYYQVDKVMLRHLIEVKHLSITDAADALGISQYLVKRAAFEEGLCLKYDRAERKKRGVPKTRECIPPPSSAKKPCQFLPVCRELEPSGEQLMCEEILEDELGIELYDRDSTPSIGYGVIPFCNLLR